MSPSFVTPVVDDEEGRRISRTMRHDDELQILMDFYYATVPVVPRGAAARGSSASKASGSTAAGRRGTTAWRAATGSSSSSR
ncbi:unnamed protein product [Urochloa humidicola]